MTAAPFCDPVRALFLAAAWRRTARVFVLAVLFGFIAVTVAQAQGSQGRGTANWRVKIDYLAELYGVTFCRENGSFYLVKGGLSAMDEASTKAHEKKHIEQHGRFKTCKTFYAWYDTPVGRLETEAEALAAGWCVQVKMGADPVSLKQSFILLLIRYYVPGTQVYEASKVFAKYEDCT
jgi:hypothetical protein